MTAPAPLPTHRDRIAVVTGAAQGIGQAVSLQLAARGATVVAVDRNEPSETCELISQVGHPVLGLRADVADPAETAHVGEQVRDAFGRCDILVNNAGIYPFRSIDDLDYATWRQVLAVNLDSQFLMAKAVIGLMRAGGWGRIVNLTSNSLGLAVPGMAHYLASKAGAIGLTRALATDLAGDGITVNAVGPTLTRTPGVTAGMPDHLLDRVSAMQAIKKIGEPADVVGTILFLTGDDSYFVTGQTIMADGGLVRL